MTRSEMIREIANQAHCSKRRVRKALFRTSARFRRDPRLKHVKFNQAFLDQNTEWRGWLEVHRDWYNHSLERGATPWTVPNVFEVVSFQSCCAVLMRINCDEDGDIFPEWVGARLYSY